MIIELQKMTLLLFVSSERSGGTHRRIAVRLCVQYKREQIKLVFQSRMCTELCSHNLDLEPMTLILDHDLRIMKTYALTKEDVCIGQSFQKLEPQQDRQTDKQTHRQKIWPHHVCGL